MDKEHVEGAVDKAVGAVKDAVGGATGNEKLQTEGKADKTATSRMPAATSRTPSNADAPAMVSPGPLGPRPAVPGTAHADLR